jgi:aromatic ring-opening dioxygenase catalytic subunit (LigB family)
MSESGKRLPTLFISHGGGPWPFMESAFGPPGMWDGLDAYLRSIDRDIGRRPQAVLVVSAHWEEAQPTVNTGRLPPLLFDYYGFPEHTYRLSYPAPGSPAVAARVRELLAGAGIETAADAARGFDHGVFIPFMLIYPGADVPIVQLSLQQGLDPAFHLAIGRALAPLRDEDVLIVGSGLSYHNLRQLMSMDEQVIRDAEAFDTWLTKAVEQPDATERERRLIAWETAPGARACHPRSDHLVPLFVAAGAAGNDLGRRSYSDHMLGKAVSAFRFG